MVDLKSLPGSLGKWAIVAVAVLLVFGRAGVDIPVTGVFLGVLVAVSGVGMLVLDSILQPTKGKLLWAGGVVAFAGALTGVLPPVALVAGLGLVIVGGMFRTSETSPI